MLIFDAHLDLALNGVDWNRDLRQAVDDIPFFCPSCARGANGSTPLRASRAAAATSGRGGLRFRDRQRQLRA